MERIFLALPLLLILLFATPPAFAQDATTREEKQVAQKERRALQEAKVAERREAQLKKIEATKERVLAKREELKEKMTTRREALKEKLDAFKDRRQAQVAENVDVKLGQVNENRTSAMTQQLSKMLELSGKIQSRIDTAAALGKDTSAATTALLSANSAIATAQTAVEAQAARDYGITVSDESKVRDSAKAARDALNADLKSTHRLVLAARQALAAAVSAAMTLGGASE